eukprot:Gb_08856 [translate_table: standard]
MADEGQPLVEDVSLRDNIDLYSELQFEIIWLQGEIAKLTDGNPCKPALMAMLESLEKMVKDFKEAGHEEDVWERIQLTGSTGPFDTGGDHVDSRPSHGDRSRIPRYVSDDEVHHMSVEDLRSLYFECRDYIHGTDITARECGYRTSYVDSTYEMEHGQALFLDAIVDDACREFTTSTSMRIDVQVHMHFETPIFATAYERVGGAGPSREFEEPQVDLTFDLTQQWPSYTGLEATTYPDMAPVVSQTHDSMTSPLSAEGTTCPDMTPVVSQTHDSVTSPLGAEATGIYGHRVIGRRSR